MPVHSLGELGPPDRLQAAATRLATLDPGVVLATGQATSGKLTTLVALALALARDGKPVQFLAERVADLEVFSPLPAQWRGTLVDAKSDSWGAAIEGSASPDAITIVAPLSRDNAMPAFSTRGSWVLAAVDTPLIGSDVAYAVKEMGVDYDSFIDRVRCIWSQLLLPRLCGTCGKPAKLSPAELEYLFPAGTPGGTLLEECGCEACHWRGTEGRDAIAEAMLFDGGGRRQLEAVLLRDEVLRLSADFHVPMQELARDCLVQGRIGIQTYRDLVRRNPLLRTRNELEREQARSSRLGNLFDRFLSPEVKQRLLDDTRSDEVIKGQSREVTCLFCDIRGFTSRAEIRDPQTLFAELNHYFAEVVDAVLTNGGTLDKFIGDAVMAVFGAPVDQADHARRAVDCGLAIRRRVEALNASRFKDMPIQVGVGINSGRAATGCVGTDERMEYTALGDAINVAARLESRAVAGEILIGEETRKQLGGRYSLESAGDLSLKGKSEPVRAFRVLGRT
jgi:class 3 adenylate cyclase